LILKKFSRSWFKLHTRASCKVARRKVCEFRLDFARLTGSNCTSSSMGKIKSARRIPQKPLEAGQLWRMKEATLQVAMVGKHLVHYKLGKPGALRVANSCNGIKAIEKFLKDRKAVLD
jgi:hypothetical protein